MIYFSSTLVGLVAMLITFCMEMLATVIWAAHSMQSSDLPPGTEVGWDLVSMYRYSPHKLAYWAISLVGFAIGFLLAYRSFSRQAGSDAAQP
jgi:hypothetical protein